MQTRAWRSEKNWWANAYNTKHDFKSLWFDVVKKYSHKIAYFKNNQTCTYQEMELEAQKYRKKFHGQKIVRISGIDNDWFSQAIAAWTENKIVVFFDPNWEKNDSVRYQLIMSEPANINWQDHPHLLLFTSGSTGKPKLVIRSTELAIYEAASYIEDILPEHFGQSICFIKPWFGAMTKHCLGMLLAGIPQHFCPSYFESTNTKTLAYGTPSLIKQHSLNLKTPWEAISLTGEKINANHIAVFKKYLDPKGFILDSYGLSECGVIARRKIFYHQIDTLVGSFSGEILSGKQVFIDDEGLVTVQALNQTLVSTGDFGYIYREKLFIKGRVSSQRKMHGVWIDTSPLIDLLSNHPMIYYVELSHEETKTGHLIVNISAHPTLSKREIYIWIFKYSIPIQLIPQIKLTYERPILGVTGKQKLLIHTEAQDLEFNYLSFLSEFILNLSSDYPHLNNLMDRSLEELGLDSLDIVNLVFELKKKQTNRFPISAILNTDTPRQIADFLSTEQPMVLRKLSLSENEKLPQMLCLGSGIITARRKFSNFANLYYTDIIDHQNQPFSFDELSKLITEQLENKPLYLVGFSIYGIFAIELAYQLEKLNRPILGLVLLDPPDLERLNYLKRKKILLKMRTILLKHWINKGQDKWHDSYCYNLRKLAIVNQPKRFIQSPSITLYSKAKNFINPWLEAMPQHQAKELNFSEHLELVSTFEGIRSWSSLACDFLKRYARTYKPNL